jgi:hypothetical protein
MSPLLPPTQRGEGGLTSACKIDALCGDGAVSELFPPLTLYRRESEFCEFSAVM